MIKAILLLLFFSFSAFCIQHFWKGTTLSSNQAVQRWGNTSFDAKKFKEGDVKIRASMAASLLKNEKIFKGKSVLEVREMLGPTDGFYFTDVYPTYLIQVGRSHSEETWQIVFLLNKDRKVETIILHKNCCD